MSRDGPKGAGGESCCVRQPCRKETPAGGMTRRLRRGRWGCRPEGGSTFFRSERKYQRKPAARRLREKALYCPFLKEGVRNVARSTVGLPTFTFVRARAHSYPLSKRARLFPFAAYCRSAPPPLGWGRNDSSAGWDVFMWFGRFSKATDQQVWENYDDRWREPEGLLPDSGLYPPSGGKLTQTGEPRGLLPSGGDFAANFLSHERPAPYGRGEGCRGSPPAQAAGVSASSPVTKVYRASAASFRRGPGRETSLESALKIASF